MGPWIFLVVIGLLLRMIFDVIVIFFMFIDTLFPSCLGKLVFFAVALVLMMLGWGLLIELRILPPHRF